MDTFIKHFIVMTPINALIISEEKDTLTILKKFEEENFMLVKIIGDANCVIDAISIIKLQKLDVVFLDINLETAVFFEMFEQLDFSIPKLIFISANESFSVKAFKNSAIDSILKPRDFNAIILATHNVIKRIEMERNYQNQKINNINILNSYNQSNDYEVTASIDKIELNLMSEIIYCQADGKYTDFFLLEGKKIMSIRNLGEYSALLDNNYFFRIHHSYIINLRHISKISKKDGYFCEF